MIFSLVVHAAEEKIPIAGQIANFYTWALGIGALIALLVLIYGGIVYTTSAGNESRIGEAKEWISGALVGLILLFGSWFILNTINPKLTKLKDLKLIINEVAQNDQAGSSDNGSASTAGEQVANVALAEFYAGVAEFPPGSNSGARVCDYLHLTGTSCPNPWCAAFVSWVFQQAGHSLGECASAGVSQIKSCAERKGWSVEVGLRSPRVGDIIVFKTDDSNLENDHAGIVIEVTSDHIVAVEGNSSNKVSRNTYPLYWPHIAIISVPGVIQ